MTLKEKLDLLGLSEKERVKVENNFLATLALISDKELKDVLDYLDSQNVAITKGREIKVLANSKDEIAKKFNILSEIHESAIYEQDPTKINHNVIDIYKKIKYCIQCGKNYKREDGTYEPFLFNEAAWQKEFNRESSTVTANINNIEPDIVTVDPNKVSNGKSENMDIQEYMAKDMADLEANTTDFATIRQELEGQLAELDSLKNLGMDEISFNDLEPESYGLGRAA